MLKFCPYVFILKSRTYFVKGTKSCSNQCSPKIEKLNPFPIHVCFSKTKSCLILSMFSQNSKCQWLISRCSEDFINQFDFQTYTKVAFLVKWASKLSRTLEDDPPAAQAELFAQMSDLILKLTLLLPKLIDSWLFVQKIQIVSISNSRV